MLYTLRFALRILFAATAVAACSSAPSSEHVGGQADELSQCRVNNNCPDPTGGGDPPPHHNPPPHNPPLCQDAHPSCTLQSTDHSTPMLSDLQKVGCLWEKTYSPGDPTLKEWIEVAYCPAATFRYPSGTFGPGPKGGYIGANVCDHCLPPPAPGYLYFFFYDTLGPTCQGGCPGSLPFSE